MHASLLYRVPNLRTPKLQASFEAPTFLIVGILEEAQVWNPIQGAFPQPIYTRCWSRSRLAVPLSMIVDSTLISCLSWRALPPSIESSNSLSEILPPRISCHASCFSESVPSVSQSRFAIKRGKSLDFRLGRSRHSCNSPVHRSITRASSQHIANEKSVHPGFSSSIKMSIN